MSKSSTDPLASLGGDFMAKKKTAKKAAKKSVKKMAAKKPKVCEFC